jgi:signal transduction histidine kinase
MPNLVRQALPVSAQEIANIQQSILLMRSQVEAEQFDPAFLLRQIDKLSTLLERLEAEQRERRKVVRFEALYNVSRLLGSSLDLQIVLDQVMDAIIQLTSAERGFLMLRDDDGDLTVTAARNLDQQTVSSDKFKYSRTIANRVLDSGQPILTTNAAEDPRFAGQASIVGQALRSIMATPMRARGRVIGVIYVDNRAIEGLFDDDDLTALDTFAGQAAVAIDNARLFRATDQALQARLDELMQLRRIDRLLNETLDPDKAMQITLEWACRLSGAQTGYLGLVELEPPRVRAVHSFGFDPEKTQLIQLHTAYPATVEVALSGKPKLFQEGRQTTLIVPVLREQDVIAVVMLNRQGDFTVSEQDVVERIVGRAAVTIENARLYALSQAADAAKSEFVGIVAHDLKVPMTSIIGYADLTLMAGGLSERQEDFQNRIRDTVRRMEVLVSDLADISRIESGHFFMNPTEVRIEEIVQAVQDSIATQIQAHKHTFVVDVAPELPPLSVDYYRLLQVLTNLLSNAIKYTPDGGTITFSVQPQGDRIEFSVSDTGIGMSREDLTMLGTKFWRADDDFTRSQPGTGLGFAITRILVEQMGGKMRIESEVGRGSNFRFSLPITMSS